MALLEGEEHVIGPAATGLSDFTREVLRVVAAVPDGEVSTYGEVAREAGVPGAARAVGGILREHGDRVPWWRVVTRSGRLVPGLEVEHAQRLACEGVPTTRGHVTTFRDARENGRTL